MKIEIPENISKTDIIVAMEEWIIGRKAQRNKEIYAKKMLDGLTFEETAEFFDMSDRQIKNLV